jgi:hypothetical protein
MAEGDPPSSSDKRSDFIAGAGRMTVTIGRRELLAALGGAAVTWPLAARAQQQPKMLRVGFVGMQPRRGLAARTCSGL